MAEKDNQLVSQSEDPQRIVSAIQRRVDEIQNPSMCYKTEFQFQLPGEIASFPKSPTAQKYMNAFEHFRAGYSCLREYGKDKVVNERDCAYLESGFQAYAFGCLLENLMIVQFPPPENTISLLTQYLKLRSNDLFAEYLKFRLLKVKDEKYNAKTYGQYHCCRKACSQNRVKSINVIHNREEGFIRYLCYLGSRLYSF